MGEAGKGGSGAAPATCSGAIASARRSCPGSQGSSEIVLGLFSGWVVPGVRFELSLGIWGSPLLFGDGEQEGAGVGKAGALQRPPGSKFQTDPGNNGVSESKW